MKNQSGFTLIELIMVIVILGILAATALPKFIDVKDDAQAAAIKGVAGGVSSSFATNYAGYLVNSTKGFQLSGTAVAVMGAIGSVMPGGLPAGYTVGPTAANCGSSAGLSAGSTVAISISNGSFSLTANQTAPATLICTG